MDEGKKLEGYSLRSNSGLSNLSNNQEILSRKSSKSSDVLTKKSEKHEKNEIQPKKKQEKTKELAEKLEFPLEEPKKHKEKEKKTGGRSKSPLEKVNKNKEKPKKSIKIKKSPSEFENEKKEDKSLKTNKIKEKKTINFSNNEENPSEKEDNSSKSDENEEKKEDHISVNGSIDLNSKDISLSRTVSIKRSNSLRNKPLFPDDLNKPSISKSLNPETQVYKIILDHETYEFDLKIAIIGTFFAKNKNFIEILSHFNDFQSIYTEKQSHKIAEIAKITDHSYYTCLDCYFEHINLLIRAKIKANDLENKLESPPESELDRCCICQCDLYESILDYKVEDIKKVLISKSKDQEEVIKLDKCDGHYFHKSCFLSFLQDKSFIKCPVCSRIYGMMIGDQPDGKMTYYVDKYSKCEGFKQYDTIIIEYNMRGIEKDNIKYPSTHRSAYLPNSSEGREVLELLKTAFERRLIFTLGTSVTTGRANQIVWNGIHHKTGLSGGSSYFGYPDPTYLNRVKLELAAKGVY